MFYMQCVLDNDISDKYYKEGVIHFKEKFNLKLEIFPANTPDTLSPELRFAHFKTSTKNRKLKQPLTPTEKACFSTHFEGWKRCIKLGQSIMIFEHDARLNPDITEDYDLKAKFDWFCRRGKDYQVDHGIAIMGKPPATAYMISPEYAARMVGWVYEYQGRRRNIHDADSKGINMQTDTFMDAYHRGFMYQQTGDKSYFKKLKAHKARKVFLQSKDYGKIVDHGPQDK